MSQQYKVVITGKLVEGSQSENVRASLIRNFKLNEQQADRFLSGKPLTVKDNLDLQSAEKFRDAFIKTGLECRVEQPAAPTGIPRAPAPAATDSSQQETLYKVVFTGTIAPGHSVQDVKQALAQLYKTDIQKIAHLFSGKPAVIKDRLDRQSAVRLQAALKKTGAVCAVQPPLADQAPEPMPPSEQVLVPETAAPEPVRTYTLSAEKILQETEKALPKCPKCGYQATSQSDPLITGMGGLGECPVCGVIVAKYVKQMSQAPVSAPETPEPSTAQAPGAAPGQKPLSGKPPAPPKVLAPEGTTTGIEVTPHFFPLAFFMYFCYAHVEINGEVHKIDSGKAKFFPLYPGTYTLRLFVPYPSKPELALIKKEITVGEKAPTRFDYRVFPWSSNPGTLVINGVKAAAMPKAKKPEAETPASSEALKQLGAAIADTVFQPDLLKRLGAAIIDSIILGLCIGGVLIGLSFPMRQPMNALLSNVYVIIGLQVVAWLYFALLESSPLQATVGKKIFNLHVSDSEGNRISFVKATFRHIARLVLLPCTLFIGFFMIAFSDRKQGLHDIASKTRVGTG